jgi:hypothetical protein
MKREKIPLPPYNLESNDDTRNLLLTLFPNIVIARGSNNISEAMIENDDGIIIIRLYFTDRMAYI